MTTPTTEPKVGSARDALAVRPFRRMFLASLVSNTGRWMQFTMLGVLGWELTGSSEYLGDLIFAQLAPLGILSLIGGSLADTANRRVLLLATQVWQMVWTFGLAVLLIDGQIDENVLLLFVFIIGLGQGIYAPAFTSTLPLIAGEENLQAAVALNSVQVNGARVVGPALGGFLTAWLGFAEVFALNAAAYLLVIAVLAVITFPPPTASPQSLAMRMFGGFTAARRASHVGRPILVMALFALLCLPFIGQLPAYADVKLGIDTTGPRYGWFYGVFGLGALVGAVAVGTVFLHMSKPLLVRLSLILFGVSLTWLATLESYGVALIAIFAVGLFYFAMPTSLAMIWQEHVDASLRGRVAALWVLAFGGMVPIANLVAGRVVEATSLDAVLFFGAIAALVLSVALPLRSGPMVGEEILD